VENCGPYYEIYLHGTTVSSTTSTWGTHLDSFSDCLIGETHGSGNRWSCSKKYEDIKPYEGHTNDALDVSDVWFKSTGGCSDINDVDCRTLVVKMTHLRRIQFTVIIRAAKDTDPVYPNNYLKFDLTVKCDSGV
jgi:hypothetical protein